MILGQVKGGCGHKALRLFQQMQSQGVGWEPVAFVGVLIACAATVWPLGEGRHVHEQMIESGFESYMLVGCSLVGIYAKS
jgi:pentatricopeptide repeat protein